MKIEHILDDDTKARLGVLSNGQVKHHPSKENVSRLNNERLSERDLAELMGINRQTYRRVNGKVKSK